MDEVDRIANTKTDHRDRPLQEQRILSMTVELFDYEFKEPEKL